MASIAAGVMASRKALATACNHHSADIETIHAAAGDEVFACAVIPRSRIPAAIVNMQTAAAMTASGESLQQCRSLSQRASCLMRYRADVGIEPRLIGLKGGPIDEARMMIVNETDHCSMGRCRMRFLTAPCSST